MLSPITSAIAPEPAQAAAPAAPTAKAPSAPAATLAQDTVTLSHTTARPAGDADRDGDSA